MPCIEFKILLEHNWTFFRILLHSLWVQKCHFFIKLMFYFLFSFLTYSPFSSFSAGKTTTKISLAYIRWFMFSPHSFFLVNKAFGRAGQNIISIARKWFLTVYEWPRAHIPFLVCKKNFINNDFRRHDDETFARVCNHGCYKCTCIFPCFIQNSSPSIYHGWLMMKCWKKLTNVSECFSENFH